MQLRGRIIPGSEPEMKEYSMYAPFNGPNFFKKESCIRIESTFSVGNAIKVNFELFKEFAGKKHLLCG